MPPSAIVIPAWLAPTVLALLAAGLVWILRIVTGTHSRVDHIHAALFGEGQEPGYGARIRDLEQGYGDLHTRVVVIERRGPEPGRRAGDQGVTA